MKILDFLNVSNMSNLEADSGYVFQKELMKEILSQRPNWEFYFISPKQTPSLDKRIKNLKLDFGHNKFEVRFSFPWNDIKKLIKDILPSIDLIYVNQSEQASNFRALATTLSPNRKIPLISYFHYLPIEPSHYHFSAEEGILDYDNMVNLKERRFPCSLRFDQTLNNQDLALPIFLKQIEAIYVSDYNIICSNFGLDLLLGNAQKLVPSISGNFAVISPPVSFSEILTSKTKKYSNNISNQKKRILFNHRLYNHYGPKEFFDFIQYFYNNKRQDFEVIVTNPTDGRSKERNKLNPNVSRLEEEVLRLPYVKLEHSKTREEYYKTVLSSYISIGPMKPSALWSMSVVDSMACGVPVLCPNYACFPEILGADSKLLFSSSEELQNKIKKLFDNPTFYNEMSAYCKKRSEEFEVKNISKKFIEVFEKLDNKTQHDS